MNNLILNNKIKQTKAILANIRIIPDLKLRSLVIIFSLCSIISAFLIGILIGKSIAAEDAIRITGANPHIPYADYVLNSDIKNSAPLNESDRNFVASDGGKVYYPKNCKGYTRIKEENRVWFKTDMLAKANGYSLAKKCTVSK